MRLLLRANAHRVVPSSTNGRRVVEVASSPDTQGRPEPWLWSVRLLDGVDAATDPQAPGAVRVALGGDAALEVRVDPDRVRPQVELVAAAAGHLVEREERGMVVLLVATGRCLVEGRHELGERDSMVLEGDDPLRFSVAPIGTDPSTVALVRLAGADSQPLGWVP